MNAEIKPSNSGLLVLRTVAVAYARLLLWSTGVLNSHALLQTDCWFHSREPQGKFTLGVRTAGRYTVNSAYTSHPSFMVGLPLASAGSREAV